MELSVRFTRVYALSSAQPTTPSSHPASPIQLAGFPVRAMQAEIHIGAVPDDVLQALKCHRAWIGRALRGGVESASELQRMAREIPEQSVLADKENLIRARAERYWYVTLYIEDEVELPEDTTQQLLGVASDSWVRLDNPDFLNRHANTLDELSAQTAIALAPYRYRWCAWDGPLVHLPTGIALRPPILRTGRARVFTAPPIEQTDLSGVQSTA